MQPLAKPQTNSVAALWAGRLVAVLCQYWTTSTFTALYREVSQEHEDVHGTSLDSSNSIESGGRER